MDASVGPPTALGDAKLLSDERLAYNRSSACDEGGPGVLLAGQGPRNEELE